MSQILKKYNPGGLIHVDNLQNFTKAIYTEFVYCKILDKER
jgi:hypothetical protein